MRKNLTSFIALLLIASAASAQDESIETFNAIRLEHSSNPGSTVTLSAPTGITQSYSLIWPSTPPSNTTQRWAFSLSGSNSSLSWYPTPLGAAGQVAYFSGPEAVVSGSNLLWDQTNQTLGISNTTGGKPALRISKTVSGLSATDTMLVLSGSFSSSAGQHLAMLQIVGSGTNAGNGTRLTGLRVNVSGADTNRAAILNGGFVGINTDYPKVYLDVAGDVAFREYNYTGSLGSTNHDKDFDNLGNKASFIRIGTATTGDVEITGIVGGYSGKILNIYNSTGHGIRFSHEDLNSAAANRINTSAEADVMLLNGNTYQLIYSGTESRWVVAYSGPGELSQLGNKEVSLNATGETIPSSTASYIQIKTPNTQNPNRYEVLLEDGTTPGQILVIQNLGPKTIYFDESNVVWDNTSDLQDGESIITVWNGTAWVQVARASN